MPLLAGHKNIGHNIEVEENTGKPHKQAVAIALSKADGKDAFRVGDKVLYGNRPCVVVGAPAAFKLRLKTLDGYELTADEDKCKPYTRTEDALPLPVAVAGKDVDRYATNKSDRFAAEKPDGEGRGSASKKAAVTVTLQSAGFKPIGQPSLSHQTWIRGKFGALGCLVCKVHSSGSFTLDNLKPGGETSGFSVGELRSALAATAKDALPLPVGVTKDAESFAKGDKVTTDVTPQVGVVLSVEGSGDTAKALVQFGKPDKHGVSDVRKLYAHLLRKSAKDALPLPVAVKGKDTKGQVADIHATIRRLFGLNPQPEKMSPGNKRNWESLQAELKRAKATDSPRTDEDEYFKRRKKIQAKLETEKPGDTTNKLRAHEQALREMGEKVTPYRTSNAKDYSLPPYNEEQAKEQTEGLQQELTRLKAIKFPDHRQVEKMADLERFLKAKAKDSASYFSVGEKVYIRSLKKKGVITKVDEHLAEPQYYVKIDGGGTTNSPGANLERDFAADASPESQLETAQHQEVAQDHARAMDSYRQAASGFRSKGDQRNEQIARDGIAECQRQAVGSYAGQFMHPSSGKVQAFDAAPDALRGAVERTRAGEAVRIAHDEATGEEVVEPLAEGKDALSDNSGVEKLWNAANGNKRREWMDDAGYDEPDARVLVLRKWADIGRADRNQISKEMPISALAKDALPLPVKVVGKDEFAPHKFQPMPGGGRKPCNKCLEWREHGNHSPENIKEYERSKALLAKAKVTAKDGERVVQGRR